MTQERYRKFQWQTAEFRKALSKLLLLFGQLPKAIETTNLTQARKLQAVYTNFQLFKGRFTNTRHFEDLFVFLFREKTTRPVPSSAIMRML